MSNVENQQGIISGSLAVDGQDDMKNLPSTKLAWRMGPCPWIVKLGIGPADCRGEVAWERDHPDQDVEKHPCDGTGEVPLYPTLLELCPCLTGKERCAMCILADANVANILQHDPNDSFPPAHPSGITKGEGNCTPCDGTGYVDVTDEPKLWAVARQDELVYKNVCILLATLGGYECWPEAGQRVSWIFYWGELTPAQRIQALETAIAEAQE